MYLPLLQDCSRRVVLVRNGSMDGTEAARLGLRVVNLDQFRSKGLQLAARGHRAASLKESP
jgi:hypothetical protein